MYALTEWVSIALVGSSRGWRGITWSWSLGAIIDHPLGIGKVGAKGLTAIMQVFSLHCKTVDGPNSLSLSLSLLCEDFLASTHYEPNTNAHIGVELLFIVVVDLSPLLTFRKHKKESNRWVGVKAE